MVLQVSTMKGLRSKVATGVGNGWSAYGPHYKGMVEKCNVLRRVMLAGVMQARVLFARA